MSKTKFLVSEFRDDLRIDCLKLSEASIESLKIGASGGGRTHATLPAERNMPEAALSPWACFLLQLRTVTLPSLVRAPDDKPV
jgi:hypothetical protein